MPEPTPPLPITTDDIVDTVREPLLVLSADLRVRRANRSFYHTFQVAPEDTEGRLVYELGNHQWDIPALRRLLEEILPQNSSFNDFEVTHDFPAIGRKVMLLNARRMYREGNHTELILLAVEDITERRRLEDERRELETRFTSLVKNIRDHSIFTLDPDGRITSWNREAERILGFGEAEAVGQHFSVIFTPEDRAAGVPAHELRTALSEGRAEDERWHLRRGGERFWALGIVSPTHDATGRHTGYSKILRDMTDRKRAEEEALFHAALLDRVGQAVIATDPNGRITYWNRSAEALYGWPRAEAIGRNVLEVTVPQPQAQIADDIMRLLSEGQNWSGEFLVRRRDGTTFPAQVTNAPILDPGGRVTAVVGVSSDITERKRAEDELRHADRRKDEFLATLAHELRNPLAPIRNGLQLLKLSPDRDTHEQARAMMERQLGQMVRLVDDLLDISRISRNKLEMRKARIDLWAVVRSAIETARPQVEARGHTLTVTLPPQPVYLDGDLTRLAQVFWNLLNNAAKYTDPGGRISLTAELHDGEAVVTVRDNGIGIPAESLPNLFEMFSQVDRSLERAEGGLGIGLALVKGLTEAHGGSVEAHSEGVGQGSTFVVRLPVAADTAPPDTTETPAATPGPRHRILVVDDNRDGAASLAMLLTLMGNDTRTAHDGLEGVEMAEAYRPDLIVLDIGLPKLNGYDACRRIREQPWAKDVVIVAATGWGQDEDRRRSQEAGFDHHLVKPVDAAEVVRLLKVRR